MFAISLSCVSCVFPSPPQFEQLFGAKGPRHSPGRLCWLSRSQVFLHPRLLAHACRSGVGRGHFLFQVSTAVCWILEINQVDSQFPDKDVWKGLVFLRRWQCIFSCLYYISIWQEFRRQVLFVFPARLQHGIFFFKRHLHFQYAKDWTKYRKHKSRFSIWLWAEGVRLRCLFRTVRPTGDC